MKKTIILAILALLSIKTNSQTETQDSRLPYDGTWNAHLIANDSVSIPIRMYVYEGAIIIHNDKEEIKLSEYTINGDSISYQFPVFDSELRLKLENKTLNGYWYNHSKGDYKMRFQSRLQYSPDAMITASQYRPEFDLKGKWDAWFSPNTENESYMIGVFKTEGPYVKGTFLSETGDYRYLQGEYIEEGPIYLSTFDGAHAYYLTFNFISKDSISGMYYSGYRWSEHFVMKRNYKAQLRDPDELTYLKEGFDKFEFELKDTKGEMVSLKDEQYKDKVVIVQIMGSWCPNCMDETRFFNELYEEYNKQGLEIVAIAFERNDNYDDFKRNIAKFTKDLEVHYNFVFGGSTKQSAEVLPMLNKIMSYPTAVFIDRKGNVRKIHTGFSGPGTGEVYEQQKRKTTHFVTKLLEE